MTGNRYIWLTLLLFTAICLQVAAQYTPGYYFIRLRDKAGTIYSVDKPVDFLSAKAIQRRIEQGIPITESDLPLSDLYLDSLKSLGLEIRLRSKWFNAVTIRTADTALLDTLENLAFISSIEKTRPLSVRKSRNVKWQEDQISLNTAAAINEVTLKQISLVNGNYLHNLGYRGKGMTITVLDAGFYHADTLPAFDSLFFRNQVSGTFDFVTGDKEVFNDHTHGMNVLSILGGNVPGKLIGTAPEAEYWLLRTEDASSEYIFEEDTWTTGAEFADSVGTDIISSSLGYFLFDDSTQNHTYQDMDGRTSRVAQAAVMAARRGIIVVTSAGNEALRPWHYIISPADADSILAVGAVDSVNNRASFSSVGPASDGRIKPEVMAMGVQNLMQGYAGTLVYGNGTSFSAPVISGLAACLWQAFPDAGAQEIIHAIIQSADRYGNPDNFYGYGTPDFLLAYNQLSSVHESFAEKNMITYPNPFTEKFFIILPVTASNSMTLDFYDLTGRILLTRKIIKTASDQQVFSISNLSLLPNGVILLKISVADQTFSTKVIKNE